MPHYKRENGSFIISFSGSLDTTTCIEVEEELYENIKSAKSKVIFDLNDVESISSMFLRICTKTAKMTGNDHIAIINANEAAMKVFTITKLDSFLSISTK